MEEVKKVGIELGKATTEWIKLAALSRVTKSLHTSSETRSFTSAMFKAPRIWRQTRGTTENSSVATYFGTAEMVDSWIRMIAIESRFLKAGV